MDKIIESTIKKLETVAIDPYPTLNPTLGVIYRADDAAAGSYLRSIARNAEKYKSTTISVQCDTIQDASLQIRKWSQDPNVNGIILISDYGEATQSLYNLIPMRLDIDGLSNKSAAHLYGSKDPIAYRKAPCTAVACLKIIQTLYNNDLAGLNVAVVGRSMRVGRPLAELLLQQDCTVTLYHSKSKFISTEGMNNFSDKDVFVSAIGQPKHFNIYNLVEQVYNELQTLAQSKEIEFKIECANKDLTVNADRSEIRRVICNLCGNAINYTQNGGRVVITLKNEGNDLIFSVADNGSGIPQEDIPNMFQRFSQGTSKKRSTGTGLGLYLSRQIIESHGGKIWLESTLNKGSEFSFLLTDSVIQKEGSLV